MGEGQLLRKRAEQGKLETPVWSLAVVCCDGDLWVNLGWGMVGRGGPEEAGTARKGCSSTIVEFTSPSGAAQEAR